MQTGREKRRRKEETDGGGDSSQSRHPACSAACQSNAALQVSLGGPHGGRLVDTLVTRVPQGPCYGRPGSMSRGCLGRSNPRDVEMTVSKVLYDVWCILHRLTALKPSSNCDRVMMHRVVCLDAAWRTVQSMKLSANSLGLSSRYSAGTES